MMHIRVVHLMRQCFVIRLCGLIVALSPAACGEEPSLQPTTQSKKNRLMRAHLDDYLNAKSTVYGTATASGFPVETLRLVIKKYARLVGGTGCS